MRVLVVNAGSSSLKLHVLDDGAAVESSTVEDWSGEDDLEGLSSFLEDVGEVDAVGHRVVHGGPRYAEPVRVDDEVLDYLDSIEHLAPLHNPRAVAGIRAVARTLSDVPAVACFDTSFHATLGPAARTYALPAEWNERWGLRRYGFHGLSHAYAVRRAAELVGRRVADLRVISCHLGSGASLAAVRGGRSVDTTMGFTPLAGLVMATRSGSLDPGLVLWLVQHGGLSVDEVADALETESGLKGLSGTSGDVREVLEGRAAGDEACALAFDTYVHRLAREVAAMTASTGGLDLLVFTGGVGEHQPAVRAGAADLLGHLGVALDPDANHRATGDADITAAGGPGSDGSAGDEPPVRTVVVTASEETEIAREVTSLLP